MATKKATNFWSFSAGNVISLLVYLVTFAYFMGQMKTIQNNQGSELRATVVKVAEIDQKLTRIDAEGPISSKKDNLSIAQTIAVLDVRVGRLEQAVSPKLEVISRDVDWIKTFLLAKSNIVLPTELPREK